MKGNKYTAKSFKNLSVFEGWKEYKDDRGTWWRVEDAGSIYKFYQKSDSAFIFAGAIRKRARGLKNIHNAFLETLEN